MVKCGRAALLAVVLLLAGMAGYQRHVSMQQDVLLNQRSREHFERMYEDALAEEAVWRSKLEAQTQRMRASLAEIDTLKGEGRAAQAQIRSSTLEKNSLLQKAEELGQRVEALQKQVAEHQQERAAAEDTRRLKEAEAAKCAGDVRGQAVVHQKRVAALEAQLAQLTQDLIDAKAHDQERERRQGADAGAEVDVLRARGMRRGGDAQEGGGAGGGGGGGEGGGGGLRGRGARGGGEGGGGGGGARKDGAGSGSGAIGEGRGGRGEEEEDSSEQEKDEDDDRDAMHGGVKLEEVTRGSKQQPAPLGIRRAAADVEDHALKSAFGTETKIGTAAAGSNGVLKRNVGLQQEEEEEQDERQEGLADAR